MSDDLPIVVFLSNTKNKTYMAAALGIILLILSGWIWWDKVHQSPKDVFWGMIENNLSTTSVTKRVRQTSSGASLDQMVQLQFGGVNLAHSFATFTQSGSVVKTEEINTPTEDDVRYVSIDTTHKDASGKALNFKPLLGIWGKTTTSIKNQANLNQLFYSSIMDTVPIGNLSAENRSKLINEIRSDNVYIPDIAHAVSLDKDGRKVYGYNVQVNQAAYVTVLKDFANYQGLPPLDSLSPDSFKDSPPLTFVFAIDAASHELLHITYPDNSHREDYSDYGLQSAVNLPIKTISRTELSNELQNVVQTKQN